MIRFARPLFAALLAAACTLPLACSPARSEAPVKACKCHNCGCPDCEPAGKSCECKNCPGACATAGAGVKADKPCCGKCDKKK